MSDDGIVSNLVSVVTVPLKPETVDNLTELVCLAIWYRSMTTNRRAVNMLRRLLE